MTETVSRDPRRDPQPFDTIKKGEVERFVVYVTATGKVVYEVTGERMEQVICDLATWRRWAKGSEVTHADAPWARSPYETKIPISQALGGQITRLANRFAHDHSISTYSDDTLLALLELGVEHALESSSFELELRRVLRKRVLPKARPE